MSRARSFDVDSRSGSSRGARPSSVATAHILIWNLYDSKTTLEELRAQLPELPPGDVWISNEAHERFGVISLAEDFPALERVR